MDVGVLLLRVVSMRCGPHESTVFCAVQNVWQTCHKFLCPSLRQRYYSLLCLPIWNLHGTYGQSTRYAFNTIVRLQPGNTRPREKRAQQQRKRRKRSRSYHPQHPTNIYHEANNLCSSYHVSTFGIVDEKLPRSHRIVQMCFIICDVRFEIRYIFGSCKCIRIYT